MSDYLKQIQNGKTVGELTVAQQERLCSELRQKMIDVVSVNGGHLASSLGVVELTVALHSAFDLPSDTLIFDVGHQCYAHKMLTGRLDDFDTLRKEGGISGFPKPSESPYDSFIEGHASTSISQAVGLSYSKLLDGDDSMTIAVIGDGALTGGLAYEAMNSISNSLSNLIVILNDNSMSISKTVGSVPRLLIKMRNSSAYIGLKDGTKKFLRHVPFVGRNIINWAVRVKANYRRKIFGGSLFEELGFNYIGPVDGHDIKEMESIFSQIRHARRGPYLVHLITQKGKGYYLAEENPGAYHGVSGFEIEKNNPDISLTDSFSNVFGRKLAEMAEKDEDICAVTAAMKYGTGLQYFAHSFKERFFDVGIAEQHAVTMCSGLSKGGKKPYFCVYSTFLQRAVDGLIHDITLDGLDFTLCVDRAGFVGDDGETHQGLYDVSFLNTIGAFRVVSPSNYAELTGWMEKLAEEKGPKAIRYPRGTEDQRVEDYPFSGDEYDLIRNGEEADVLLVTYGREFAECIQTAYMLAADGIKCDILKLNVICPLPAGAAEAAAGYHNILFAEEALRTGGIGEKLLDALNSKGYGGRYAISAIENVIIKQAEVKKQIQHSGLDAASLYARIRKDFFEKET